MSKVLEVALLLLLVAVAASAYAVPDENAAIEDSGVQIDAGENADNQTKDRKLPQIDDFGETKKCPANEPFKWKCNHCKCNSQGTDAACTKMLCP